MKVVLDTNVFVSGVFFKGPPYQILKAWQEGKIELIVSPEILDEYRRVGEILAEDYHAINLSPMLGLLIRYATVYSAPPLPIRICDDPDDDKFFACALASGVATIVSGDRHLLKASGYQGTVVLKPRDFIDKYLV